LNTAAAGKNNVFFSFSLGSTESDLHWSNIAVSSMEMDETSKI
jgi:hypothetical protein